MASLQNRGASPLGYELAAHLLRRATYNITKSRIEHFATLNVNQALDELLDYPSFSMNHLNMTEPVAYDTGNPYTHEADLGGSTLSSSVLRYIQTNWFIDEAKRATTLQFKLATFLFGNFVADDITNYKYYYDYMSWLIYYSKESYKDLAYKITYDNRMLYYLSNHYNTVASPNENYAREFLELFTITKGTQIAAGNYTNYTEHDVQQGARVLTGFRIDSSRSRLDPDTNIPTGKPAYSLHDTGDKTFSSAFGGTVIRGATNAADMFRELQDYVNMIFDQDETAKVICRKLYRYFVRRNIDNEVENDIIIPLANTLRNNNYELGITVRELLSSQHFYDEDDTTSGDEIIGALVKPPLDLLLQSLNLLNAGTAASNDPDEALRRKNYLFYITCTTGFLRACDMELFRPLSVAGYKAVYQEPDYDKLWFTFNTMDARYSIGKSILTNRRAFSRVPTSNWFLYPTFDIVDYVRNSGNFSNPRSSSQLIQEVYDLLLVKRPEPARQFYFLRDLFLRTLSAGNWRDAWDLYISTNDDTLVRGHLESLFEGIIASPEYQIF